MTKLFPLLENAIGTFGMTGLDRLIGLQSTTVLQKIVGVMETNVFKDKTWFDLLENMSNSLNPIENVIAQVSVIHKSERISIDGFSCLHFQPIFFSLLSFITNNYYQELTEPYWP